ncbi:hypothetical protein FRB90_001156, partial [Tulasnella sp. 427]
PTNGLPASGVAKKEEEDDMDTEGEGKDKFAPAPVKPEEDAAVKQKPAPAVMAKGGTTGQHFVLWDRCFAKSPSPPLLVDSAVLA